MYVCARALLVTVLYVLEQFFFHMFISSCAGVQGERESFCTATVVVIGRVLCD